MECEIFYYIFHPFYYKKVKIMKTKIRKEFDWKQWKQSNSRHNMEILATHIAIIIGVFVFAACL
ncbi:hypothetical protein A0O34_14400 [Chryseobacterium glaciei]|uniref:Uncharacterized protein n=1 Tax=Chryseobacterium glaciei TaxID=1685010 RepID=A0A172XXE8_9FLAO|nr:hypothetical protein A0O34_14400 [Chryseobacterium glaciei]